MVAVPSFRWLLAASAAVGLALPTAAQVVRGTVVSDSTQRPVSSTLVRLLDSAGRRVSGAFTDSSGRFSIKAPTPGEYSLRADRIGYRSRSTPLFALSEGEVHEVTLVASAVPVVLRGITVSGEARCGQRTKEGDDAARVWEEARKALDATSLTQEQGLFHLTLDEFDRDVTPSGTVIAERRRRTEGGSANPFVSAPAESLAKHGYVVVGKDSTDYYAPDAEVLLSDIFAAQHCWRLRGGGAAQAGLIGLAFEPATHGRVDVGGVLWLDESSSELRSLEFEYIPLPLHVGAKDRGGRVAFQRLPNGTWLVSQWLIRMPMIGRDDARAHGTFGGVQEITLAGIREAGGEVVRMTTREGGLLSAGALASIEGSAYDSLRRLPLSGATITIVGSNITTQTDSMGVYHLTQAPLGAQTLQLEHSIIPLVGLASLRRQVTLVQGQSALADFALPSVAALLAGRCSVSGGASTLLVGRVRDVRSGRSIPAATVILSWKGWEAAGGLHLANRSDTTVADSSGVYRVCGIPPSTPLTLRVDRANTMLAEAEIRVRQNELLVRDLFVPAAGAANRSQLSITTTTRAGTPARHALVSIDGVGAAEHALTDSAGVAHMYTVPTGTRVVEVRLLGYEPARATVDIDPELETQLAVSLERAVQVLPAVNVIARSAAGEFESRRKRGQGYFITPEMIAEQRALFTTDLVAGVPGMTVTTTPDGNQILHARGAIGDQVNMGSSPGTYAAIPARGAPGGISPPSGIPDNSPLMSGQPPPPQDYLHGPSASCEVAYYIDGARERPILGEINTVIKPGDIWAIEVYPNSAEAPARYAAPDAPCGIVLIWSRQGAARRSRLSPAAADSGAHKSSGQ